MKFDIALFLLMALRPADAALSTWQGCRSPETLQGDREFAEGRYPEAYAAYEASFAKLEPGISSADAQAIPCLMDRLATALVRMGKLKDALPWSLRAVERSRTLAANPTTAILANNAAGLYLELGDVNAAERWAREAMLIATQTHRQNQPEPQLMWTTLASIHVYRGDFARAEPLFRSALFHIEMNYGPRHIEVGLAAGNLADIYRSQDRHAKAIEMYRKAIAVFESLPEVANRQMLWVRSGLMVSCAYSGRAAEAESLAGSALKIAEQTYTANDSSFAAVLHHVALVRLSQGDLASARQLCERALVILETTFGAESLRIIAPLQTYARIVRSAKDKHAANRIDARVRMLMRAANP